MEQASTVGPVTIASETRRPDELVCPNCGWSLAARQPGTRHKRALSTMSTVSAGRAWATIPRLRRADGG